MWTSAEDGDKLQKQVKKLRKKVRDLEELILLLEQRITDLEDLHNPPGPPGAAHSIT